MFFKRWQLPSLSSLLSPLNSVYFFKTSIFYNLSHTESLLSLRMHLSNLYYVLLSHRCWLNYQPVEYTPFNPLPSRQKWYLSHWGRFSLPIIICYLESRHGEVTPAGSTKKRKCGELRSAKTTYHPEGPACIPNQDEEETGGTLKERGSPERMREKRRQR